MAKVNLGMIGLGTVGQGVLKVIEANRELIRKKSGVEIAVKTIADRSAEKKRGMIPAGTILSDNPDDVLEDDSIDIVIELIGGEEPARSWIVKALRSGKQVVTANKAVISAHYAELVGIASENNVSIKFEASTAGCVPIIKSLKESLVADEIVSLYGILNGTTNFILTSMTDGSSYAEALAEAQDRGFAEADPTFDVSGQDAAQKLVILAIMAFNVNASIADVYVEGIERIAASDIANAGELGYAVKLLAIAKQEEGKLDLRVHPVLMPKSHLIATVKNELNAVFVRGRFVDEQMYYGKGAGQLPTATAVVSDVVDILLHREQDRDLKDVEFVRIQDIHSYYYVRFTVSEQTGVLADIARVLADNDISILSVVQRETERETLPIVMLTHRVKESSMNKAIEKIDSLGFIKDKTLVIRIEKTLEH